MRDGTDPDHTLGQSRQERRLTVSVSLFTVFHMTRNTGYSETNLLAETTTALRSRMPPGWSLKRLGKKNTVWPRRTEIDATLSLADSQGVSATVMVEVKVRPVEARQVLLLMDQWQRLLLPWGREVLGSDNLTFMIVAPFLGPSARERLAEAGISYADATGNIRFVTNQPAVFIETQGAVRNPWREKVRLRSLQGRRSGRVVRAFLDYRPPFGTRELATLTANAPASISRVADLLDRDGIIEREAPRKAIVSVDWERLLQRWALDYEFPKANRMTPCLEPRGLPRLFDKLRDLDLTYAVTGSFAAVRYAPVAEPRTAVVYAGNPEEAIKRLGLRPADTGANVLIGQPFDPVVFDRTEYADGITYARVTQVVPDLMTGPGRGPAEAESLVEWMRSTEELWRLPLMQTT